MFSVPVTQRWGGTAYGHREADVEVRAATAAQAAFIVEHAILFNAGGTLDDDTLETEVDGDYVNFDDLADSIEDIDWEYEEQDCEADTYEEIEICGEARQVD